MSDLAEFLRARLAEDEDVARSAAGERWTEPHRLARHPDTWQGYVAAYREGVPTGAQLVHIDRHDPNRVLAEVETKRRVVELHGPATLRGGAGARYYETTRVCRSCEPPKQFPETAFPCQTLRLLALPYADHPEYRKEWRP